MKSSSEIEAAQDRFQVLWEKSRLGTATLKEKRELRQLQADYWKEQEDERWNGLEC